MPRAVRLWASPESLRQHYNYCCAIPSQTVWAGNWAIWPDHTMVGIYVFILPACLLMEASWLPRLENGMGQPPNPLHAGVQSRRLHVWAGVCMGKNLSEDQPGCPTHQLRIIPIRLRVVWSTAALAKEGGAHRYQFMCPGYQFMSPEWTAPCYVIILRVSGARPVTVHWF
jgi:hypothetical protein